MLVTLVLVVGVIFLFLHNGSATLIPGAGAAVLDSRHVRRDAAAQLQPRQPVDDGADPLGRLRRRRCDRDAREHRAPHGAGRGAARGGAATGSKEIGFTIISMTMSLAAVFIPILFMSGILGRLFREFAVTITTAILISGVVSVTLTPMLCSRFLRVSARTRRRGFAGLMDRAFDAPAARRTSGASRWVLRHRIGDARRVRRRARGHGRACSTSCRRASFPIRTTTQMNVQLRAAQGTSYYEMVRWAQQVADIVIKNPYVDSFTCQRGQRRRQRRTTAACSVQLTPRASTPAVGAADRAAARTAAAALPGLPQLRPSPHRRSRSAGARATRPTAS